MFKRIPFKRQVFTSVLMSAALGSAGPVLADLEVIDDAKLSHVTGQKGLTIDIDMGVEIGEFMYKDAGSVVMQGVRVGGMDRTAGEVGTKFDGSVGIVADGDDPTGDNIGDNAGGTTGLNNIRITVDIAGDGSDLGNNGSIDLGFLGTVDLPDNYFNWAWGRATLSGGGGALGCGASVNSFNCEFLANDGDLFIHASPTDATAVDSSQVNGPGGSAATIADFGYEMDRFALKDSTYVAGDDINDLAGSANSHESTDIITDLKMEGYFGGFDLYIQNNGNGFGTYDDLGVFTETGAGDAASKIMINTFFKITEMEYDFDIAGIRYEKIAIGNTRGNVQMWDMFSQEDYTGPGVATSQGFAQANTHIFAVRDAVLNLAQDGSHEFVSGISMDSRFTGDMDIEHLSFGDHGVSIGSIYYTDMDFVTERVISAH